MRHVRTSVAAMAVGFGTWALKAIVRAIRALGRSLSVPELAEGA